MGPSPPINAADSAIDPFVDPTSDAAIAQSVSLRPIEHIAEKLGIPPHALLRYGTAKAKLDLAYATETAARAPAGKLILVTAISPTPAGEGKTTTTIGLGDALSLAGHRTAICLREPSLGPCFGAKGGATGGGRAQVAPAADINLHFTGDMHAITAAHNLLASLIDNHVYWGNSLDIDTRRITWRRVMDLNERALRHIAGGLGGSANGYPREDGFDITAASEVMAIFCLANSLPDLQQRLANIVIGQTRTRRPVTAADLGATGAMTALLRDALSPNLVQTLEATPALIHGGPFANIAHGCNSVLATRTALNLADYVVTEAGFGADLGAEKFLDIKCRKANLAPAAIVVVATVRALKFHGGVALKDLNGENPDAVTAGSANLIRHIHNMRRFNRPVVVAINRFTNDTQAELDAIIQACAAIDTQAIPCTHWADGGAGATGLADAILRLTEAEPEPFRLLYEDSLPLGDKIRTIATTLYGAAAISFDPHAEAQLNAFTQAGHANLPICMAKTQYSFATDPTLKGAPENFILTVREVRLSAGAGFIVALCGDILTMPGLPRHPAALDITVSPEGIIAGLA